jgi:DNA (cytosine-5)-methyltransferase 1
MKPRCIDLFCGAGGAAKGLQRAGYYVVGVDIKKQPRYCGDEFHQADAMTFPLNGFDFLWASPPCQRYSQGSIAAKSSHRHPDLVAPVRNRLHNARRPWVIENVPRSPVRQDIVLCGSMFRLELRRHRYFECHPIFFSLLPACDHSRRVYSVFGHGSGKKNRSDWGTVADWKRAMGIDWMIRNELTQAIPPAYSKYIGEQMLPHVLRAMGATDGP